MSGGSFDYLCFACDLQDLSEKRWQLQQMADELAGLGYAKDAAVETLNLIRRMNQLDAYIESANQLRDVWRAVEWWRSADYSEDQVKEALAKYRGEDLKTDSNT